MKHTPEDFKEILGGGEDRVAKAKRIKEAMKGYKNSFKFSVRRRKLATGYKYYFTADAIGPQYKNNPEVMWGRPLRDFVLNTVRTEFPDASVSSGGGYSVTVVEY